MKRPEERFFAVIADGVVTNIIVGVEDHVVAANPEVYVEYAPPDKDAGIGYTYDGRTFTKPKTIEAPSTPVK